MPSEDRAAVNTPDETTPVESAGDTFDAYAVGTALTSKAPKWRVTIAPNEVKFARAEGKGLVKVARGQASKKIRFPNRTFAGRGKSKHLRGLPLVEIITAPGLFAPSKLAFAVTPEGCEKLRDWVPPITKSDLKKDLRGWGISLVLLGIAHLVFAKFLDPIWGVIIIVLGALNFVIVHRAMFVANGISLIVVGVMNVINGLVGANTLWATFGVFQAFWGVQEILKFGRYASIRE